MMIKAADDLYLYSEDICAILVKDGKVNLYTKTDSGAKKCEWVVDGGDEKAANIARALGWDGTNVDFVPPKAREFDFSTVTVDSLLDGVVIRREEHSDEL